jgi:ABC-type lipoprotein export system ATPase subunit
VVLVTHDPGIARYAQRVVTVRDGAILSDVRHTPESRSPDDHAAAPDADLRVA